MALLIIIIINLFVLWRGWINIEMPKLQSRTNY
jgi:hypothetical protein